MPSIDYLSFTIQGESLHDPKSVIDLAYNVLPQLFREDIFGEYFDIYKVKYEYGKGKLGYEKLLKFENGIKVYYEPAATYGIEQGRKMGTHFVISGKCFSKASMFFDSEMAFLFLKKCHESKFTYHFSRCDIAYDTMDYNIELFREKIENDDFVTRCRNIDYITTQIKGIKYTKMITIGRRDGLAYFRIYDKAREQKISGVWTRIEGEFKRDGAIQALEGYANGKIGNYFMGHFRIVDKKNETNISRSEVWSVYMSIINSDDSFRVSALSRDSKDKYIRDVALPFVLAYYECNPKVFEWMLNHCKENIKLKKQLEKRNDTVLHIINKTVDDRWKEIYFNDMFNDISEQLSLFEVG